MNDHHIIHAARGASNVWTAAIVAGLAVVLTGAIAYTAVEAQSAASNDATTTGVMQELSKIDTRLTAVEDTLRQNAVANAHAQATDAAGAVAR